MPRLQALAFFAEYLVARFVAAILNLFPLSWITALADLIGSFLFHLLKKRREIMLSNLRCAYPQKTGLEIRKMAAASTQNLVRMAFEFIRLAKIDACPEHIFKLPAENTEEVSKALGRGKGVIFLVSHLSNWELMGLYYKKSGGRPLHAVARPLKNPFLYGYVQRLRRLSGIEPIAKNGAIRNTIRLLKKNQIVAMLIDQHERQGGVWVDFFGRPACTTALPAFLGLEYGAAVIPVFMHRQGPERFTLRFGAIFDLRKTGNRDADIRIATQQFVSCMEAEIRKYPEEWLWMHRRWRSNLIPTPPPKNTSVSQRETKNEIS